VNISLEVCEGLGFAHRAGLVHCDIKPQNILVRADRHAKITDFGIARAIAQNSPEALPSGSAEREPAGGETTGSKTTVWGSPQYFSPEQAAGEPLTPASDVYSAGVMLFEMLTGRLPFPGRDPRTLALQHLHEPPPLPHLLNPAVPPALEEIILRAMAKDPAARYRNGEQMARVLHALLTPVATAVPAVFYTTAAAAAPAETPDDGETLALEEEEPAAMDWKAVALGFVSLIAIGGLIPVWVYVYFLYNPPGH
jgi:serine/threonine-protein kinase